MFKRVAAICALIFAFADVASAQAQVLTTIKPLQLIAAELMDGIAEPELLIPANVSPHHFTLRPSDVRKVTDARLVLWVGPQMETYLTDFLGELDSSTTVVEFATLDGITLYAPASAEVGHEEDGRYDPHVWLDTRNARLLGERMAQALIALDPAHQARYQANLSRFTDSMGALEMTMAEAVEPMKDGRYAVYHDGLQYFEKQFGLEHQFVLVPDHEIQPGIRHILDIRSRLDELRPTCLLDDVDSNDSTTETVFADYPINKVRIDTLGAAITSGPGAYAQLIGNLAQAINTCLGQ
ncbi:MAG: zinc ABC transporter substrate-binding protein [Pseudomonadota bacterium]